MPEKVNDGISDLRQDLTRSDRPRRVIIYRCRVENEPLPRHKANQVLRQFAVALFREIAILAKGQDSTVDTISILFEVWNG
jgi:hypothetical protein